MKKIALVFGITGQDGSYLAELLLNKNYLVYGVKRRTSLIHTTRIDHIYKDFHLKTNLILKYGDVTDFSNVFNLINEIKPDEIYNLAAQSNVGVSFELAEYTAQTDSIGTLRILRAIRIIDKKEKLNFIKLQHQKYLETVRINRIMKKVDLNLFHLMEQQNSILTGQQEIIGMLTRFLHQMAFYLIMNHPEEEKILSQEKQF